MFRNLKFALVCALVVGGMSACSSDDSNDSGKSGNFEVTVLVTEGSSIETVMVLKGDASGNTAMDTDSDIVGTTYTKVISKDSKEKVMFSAQGFGADKQAQMLISVTNGGKTVTESSASGEVLVGQVTF